MNLAVVGSAQRHGELVACFAAERFDLGKAQMVRITGPAAADQTGLLGDEFEMRLVPDPARFGEPQGGLIDGLLPQPMGSHPTLLFSCRVQKLH